jgi:uncharacterized protein (DUF2062 family)
MLTEETEIMMISLNNLKNFIKDLLKQGMSPDKIALSVALGGVLGIFPIPGISTAMCALLAMTLRLNHAMIQTVNYAVYPLQLLLLGVYIAIGNQWFGGSASVASFNSLADLIRHDLGGGLLALKQLGLYAVVVWLVTSPLLAVAVYIPSRLVAVKIQGALKSAKATALDLDTFEKKPNPPPVKNSSEPIGRPDETWQPARNLGCETCLA